MLAINYKRLSQTATVPTKGSPNAAGWDLYADLDSEGFMVTIEPNTSKMINTNIAVEIPDGFYGELVSRSGLSKKGIRLANCVGIIDPDYRGGIKVNLFNDSSLPVDIMDGDRVAQLIIHSYENAEWIESDSLSSTQRGTGGFGHSGR